MKKITKAVKHYIKESIDSLFVDQLASFLFGIIVTWFIRNNILEINDEAISIGIKFLILFTVFLVVYTISTILQLRPDRYKFRMKSVNILVEYLGDTIRVNSKYTFSTNRIKSNRMYTRRDWFSDETFKFRCLTKGYKTKKISSLGNTHEYYIIFPEDQYFWQTKSFECEFTGSNKKRKYGNFYWYDVICPTEKLTIEVHIPRQYCTDRIKLKSFLNYEVSDNCNITTIENFNGAYKWEVEPKLGWSYKFEWEWS